MIFGKGLSKDVETRYHKYLENRQDKLITTLICAILSRANLPINRTVTDCANTHEIST